MVTDHTKANMELKTLAAATNIASSKRHERKMSKGNG